jgi:hypothetical protein
LRSPLLSHAELSNLENKLAFCSSGYQVYFYAPSDSVHTTRFRSEKKLREYLSKNAGVILDLPPPEAFDWSYPGK